MGMFDTFWDGKEEFQVKAFGCKTRIGDCGWDYRPGNLVVCRVGEYVPLKWYGYPETLSFVQLWSDEKRYAVIEDCIFRGIVHTQEEAIEPFYSSDGDWLPESEERLKVSWLRRVRGKEPPRKKMKKGKETESYKEQHGNRSLVEKQAKPVHKLQMLFGEKGDPTYGDVGLGLIRFVLRKLTDEALTWAKTKGVGIPESSMFHQVAKRLREWADMP